MQMPGSQIRLTFGVVLYFVFSWLCLFGLVAAGFAQTPTGAIGGAIRDATGVSIPKATVNISNQDTGVARSTLTANDGSYQVAGLPAGTYRVTVEAPSFRGISAMVSVETGATTIFHSRLELGATTERVYVEGIAPQMNPGDSALLRLQAADLKARCSAGPIEVLSTGGRSHYKGLLVKIDKRFSKHLQFLASYALASNVGFNTTVAGQSRVLNKNNWFENFGPMENDRRHVLNVSGTVELPRGFQVGFISSFASRAPFSAWISAVDSNGDGTWPMPPRSGSPRIESRRCSAPAGRERFRPECGSRFKR